jgi:signal transduction histidine kinase
VLFRRYIAAVKRSFGSGLIVGVDEESQPSGEMTEDVSVTARIRRQQLHILDGDLLSGTANIPAVMMTAFGMRHSVSAAYLEGWIVMMALAIGAQILAIAGPFPWRTGASRPKRSIRARLATHVVFTTTVGAVWGAGCLAFGPSLSQQQMMFLTVIIIGCNAACISALGPYLPAFLGYFIGSLAPLAYVNFVRPSPDSPEYPILVLLFMATLMVNVRAFNINVLAAFRLRAENEALAETLLRANAAIAAAAQSKWDTLAHLSHELRTPMTAIIGFSEMMREQFFGPLGERYLDYAGHIHDRGRHAMELIDAILEVSNAETGRLSLTESKTTPAALVAECLRMVEAAATLKNLTIESFFDDPGLLISVDQAKLRQALVNLLSNAIKYTPDGGSVSVVTQRVESGLEIAVEDTGVGIAADDLERCLEPFVRLRNPLTAGVEGAGLGLPLARYMVEVQGGELNIASELGRGTVVTIHLPSERLAA